MRTRLTVAVASLAGLLITAVPVVAHHSFAAEYDASKPIKLTGTVTKIEWTNPHCFFHIDVKNEQSSKIENWALEMASYIHTLDPTKPVTVGYCGESCSDRITDSVNTNGAKSCEASGNIGSEKRGKP